MNYNEIFNSFHLQSHALLNRVENVCSLEEREELKRISANQRLRSTLLPVFLLLLLLSPTIELKYPHLYIYLK